MWTISSMLNRSSIFTFYVFIFEQDSVVPHIGPSCFHLMGIFNSRRKLRLLRVLDIDIDKVHKKFSFVKSSYKIGWCQQRSGHKGCSICQILIDTICYQYRYLARFPYRYWYFSKSSRWYIVTIRDRPTAIKCLIMRWNKTPAIPLSLIWWIWCGVVCSSWHLPLAQVEADDKTMI